MIQFDLLGEKLMVNDLTFVQLYQMIDDDSNLIKLYELRAYIDQANKNAITTSRTTGK